MSPTKVSAATNPFRSERVIALPFQPQQATWEALLANLEAMNWHGAVVGPCGTGKTTLLDRLAPELEKRGFTVHPLRLDTTQRRLPVTLKRKWLSTDALLLDGAEQLSPWNWRRFRAHTKGVGALIITSHHPGLLPTWLATTTSPALLQALCGQLGVTLEASEIEEIFHANNGNLRFCLMELYDRAGNF